MKFSMLILGSLFSSTLFAQVTMSDLQKIRPLERYEDNKAADMLRETLPKKEESEEDIIQNILKSVELSASQEKFVKSIKVIDQALKVREKKEKSQKSKVDVLSKTQPEREHFDLLIKEHNALILLLKMYSVKNQKKQVDCNNEVYGKWTQVHLRDYEIILAKLKNDNITLADHTVINDNFNLIKSELKNLQEQKIKIENECIAKHGNKEINNNNRGDSLTKDPFGDPQKTKAYNEGSETNKQ